MSLVDYDSCLLNYGGLLKEQYVLELVQIPSNLISHCITKIDSHGEAEPVVLKPSVILSLILIPQVVQHHL